MGPYFLFRRKVRKAYELIGVECAWNGPQHGHAPVARAKLLPRRKPDQEKNKFRFIAMCAAGPIAAAGLAFGVAAYYAGGVEALIYRLRGYPVVDAPGPIVWPSLSTPAVAENALRGFHLDEVAKHGHPAKKNGKATAMTHRLYWKKDNATAHATEDKAKRGLTNQLREVSRHF